MFDTVSFVVTAGALVVGLTVLLTRRSELSKFWQTLLSITEVVVLITSTVLFGWWGLGIATVVLLIAALTWSYRLHIQWEATLVAAVTRGRLDLTKDEGKAFARRLQRSDRALQVVRPTGLTNLIRLLSECGRDAHEIEAMAPTVARIWVIYDYKDDPDAQERITRKFDQCLRLWSKDPPEAERVADTLVAATKHGPSTFEEMLDAMIAVVHP